MTRYLLHIGLPKTGTKYLQTNFRRLSGELARRGILYPADWWQHDSDVNHDRLADQLRTGDIDALRPIFDRLNASRGTVLISCEGLSGFGHPELARLRTLLGDNPVETLLYCRRWSDWIPSAWQQTVKQGGSATFPEYLADMLQHARSVTAINVAIVVRQFELAFGAGSVKLISYSNLLDSKTDIVEHFFRAVLRWEDVPVAQAEQVHESMGMFVAELVRIINALRFQNGTAGDLSAVRGLPVLRERPDLRELIDGVTARMNASAGEIEVNDASPGLQELFENVNATYGHLLLRQSQGEEIFAPQRKSVRFVRQDYLADPEAAAAVQRICLEVDALTRHSLTGTFDPAEFRRFAGAVDAAPRLSYASGGRAADYLASHPAAGGSTNAEVETRLDVGFGTTGAGPAVLRAGWSRPEVRSVWSDGQRSDLVIPRQAADRNYALLLIVRPFVRDTRLAFQRAEISVNGHSLGGVDLTAFAVLECRLPWKLLAAKDDIEIGIDLPNAARPVDFGGSSDHRQLALCLERAILFAQRYASLQDTVQVDHAAAPSRTSDAGSASSQASLIAQFESLGENCEFGLVQRRCGIEPLGLLRFSSTPLPPLLHALRSRFAGMGQPDTIAVETAASGREYMIFDRRYGFRYHAWVTLGEMAPEAIHAREARRLPFLIRKLVEDLTEGEKIFIFHGMQPLAEGQARELADAIRSYGPGTLLWVEQADAAHPPGNVLPLAPGLLKGHMDRFAPGEDAHDLSLDCWLTLCRNADAMVRVQQAA